MKIEELRQAIQFAHVKTSINTTAVTATLTVSDTLFCNFSLVGPESIPAMEQDVRDRLVHRILRHLYDDRRREMTKALMDLAKCDPFDYQAQAEARDKVLMAAKFLMPAGEGNEAK